MLIGCKELFVLCLHYLSIHSREEINCEFCSAVEVLEFNNIILYTLHIYNIFLYIILHILKYSYTCAYMYYEKIS